jgi:circadian clock protein KaiC
MQFGGARRRLQVQKLRGVDFCGGWHDFAIRTGGLEVFPRLVASNYHTPFVGEATPSGVPELDSLMGGGPLRGTTTLITGPAGAGKSTIALQYLVAACQRKERTVIYEFDERVGTLLQRARALGLDLTPHISSGMLHIQQVDPAEISPGEFTSAVRREVDQHKTRVIIIDSLSGYMTAMPEEKQLVLQMHELLSFLNQQGVVTFLINPQQGLVGTMQSKGINISYIADAVLLLRFFEAEGRIRKAISVLKNRGGQHEDSIRELRMDSGGVRIGAPLTDFRGVLTGTPEYIGKREPLLEERLDDE